MTTPKSKWKSKYKNLDRAVAKASLKKRENDRYQFRCRAVRLFDRYGKEIVEDLDISERSLYRWKRRVREDGFEGLKDKSKRPNTIHRISDEIVQKVIQLRDMYHEGCEKIALTIGISARTVHKILSKAGLLEKRKKKRRWRHFQRNHANSLWQMDYSRIYEDLWITLVVDDHSRFIIGYRMMKTPNVEDTLDFLEECIGKYGVPREILTDHGTQFYSVRGGESTFDMYCLEKHIDHILASVKHPQTNGKVERKFGVLKEYLEIRGVLCGEEYTRVPDEEVEKEVDKYVEYHNYSRYHFTYERHTFGDFEKKRKVHFLPYLRFVCHRS